MQAPRSGKTFHGAEPTENDVGRACDVIVQRNGESEWVAISRQAAVIGETLILEVVLENGESQQLAMCVVESRRFILDGDARYWIRLVATELPPILYEQQVRRG